MKENQISVKEEFRIPGTNIKYIEKQKQKLSEE
jgi:hypothetical protein